MQMYRTFPKDYTQNGNQEIANMQNKIMDVLGVKIEMGLGVGGSWL
jgi:hypothetical protein